MEGVRVRRVKAGSDFGIHFYKCRLLNRHFVFLQDEKLASYFPAPLWAIGRIGVDFVYVEFYYPGNFIDR